MDILITGAGGYIGKSLTNYLSADNRISAITRNDINLANYLQVSNFFLDKKYDIVIHCAVAGGNRLVEDSWDVLDTNLQMYYNIIEQRKKYSRLIHFGSGAELTLPNTPYGTSKQVISKSILEKENFFNLKIFAVFDENELDQRFIKSNIIRYIRKEPILIHQDKYMDFFYMQDLCKLVKHFIDKDSLNLSKQIDCTYKEKYLLSDIAIIINNLSNYKVPIIVENKGVAQEYIGQESPDMDFQGLEKGIQLTYNQLKKLF